MRSPEEAKLDFLLGQWTSSDRTYPGPFGPGGTSEGEALYRWEVGDKWLIYDFSTHVPGLGPYTVRGGVAYDPTSHAYKAYSVNSMGNLLLYEGRSLEPVDVSVIDMELDRTQYPLWASDHAAVGAKFLLK